MSALVFASCAGCGAVREAPQAESAAGQTPDAPKEHPDMSGEVDAAKEKGQPGDAAAVTLADGVYTVEFQTDSSMFHLNESCEGRAVLTVKEGGMTVHVPLVSKSIVNLFPGTAQEARAAGGSAWLNPVTETVTYSDGYTEEVYAFDVPVPAVGVEFSLALIGTKGKWYDHMVSVTDPQPVEGALANGIYRMEVTLSGGTGRVEIESPALVTVSEEGMTAKVVWSSPYYDYMLVDGVKYEPVNQEGNAAFEIPICALDTEILVTADTVAMSVPHEIDYTLVFHSKGAQEI